MASNLKPFLTEIANAIRTKKGTSAPINAQNFATEIGSIASGGSSGGLVGYSGTVYSGNITGNIAYLLEDGSMGTVPQANFDTTKKYVCLALKVSNSNYGISSPNTNFYSINTSTSTYYLIRPMEENWHLAVVDFSG